MTDTSAEGIDPTVQDFELAQRILEKLGYAVPDHYGDRVRRVAEVICKTADSVRADLAAARAERDEARHSLKLAENVNGLWQRRMEAAEAKLAGVYEECAVIATNGCLVPPDGGSPTEAERQMCDNIAAAIRQRAGRG